MSLLRSLANFGASSKRQRSAEMAEDNDFFEEPLTKRHCNTPVRDSSPEDTWFSSVSAFLSNLLPSLPTLRHKEQHTGDEPEVVGGIEMMRSPLTARSSSCIDNMGEDVIRSSPNRIQLTKKPFPVTPHPRSGHKLIREDLDNPQGVLVDLSEMQLVEDDEEQEVQVIGTHRNSWLRNGASNGISNQLNSFRPVVRAGNNDGLVDVDDDDDEDEVVLDDDVQILPINKNIQTTSALYSRFRFKPSVTSTAEKCGALPRQIEENRWKSGRADYKIPKSFSRSVTRRKASETLNACRTSDDANSNALVPYRRGSLLSRSRLLAAKLGLSRKYLETAQECYKMLDKEAYKMLLKQSAASGMNLNRSSIMSNFSGIAPVPLSKVNMGLDWARMETRKIEQQESQDAAHEERQIVLWSKEAATAANSSVVASRASGTLFKDFVSGTPASKTSGDLKIDTTFTTATQIEDDDLIITKETVHRQVVKPTTADAVFMQSFYKYSPGWVQNLHSNRDRKKNDLERLRRESEMTVKLCVERRKKGPSVEDAVMHRFKLLDMRHPTPVYEIPEEEVLPELSRQMENVINAALRKNPPGEVLTEKFNIQITRRDIATLEGLNWLNDEVINFYMNLLMERSQNNKQLPSVYAFNTFFYPKLMKMGFSGVKRWTKKIDVFSYELLLVPVHLGMHWCLATVNLKKKLISYYDSMSGENRQCLQELRKYLEQEHIDKKQRPLDICDFDCVILKDIPQQMNGSDCGMFTCKFAEYLSRGRPITFTQDHMPYFRRRMVYEIVTNKLL